jgi:ABC-2 type transport system ATP-binding protein
VTVTGAGGQAGPLRGSRPVIEVRHLTKHYGPILAVDDLSFTVAAGQVTGFLGPNGSGKSTTMRMIVGLDAPTAGQVTVAGRSYGQLRFPLREVGAILDAGAAHPGRTARDHLAWLAASNDIPGPASTTSLASSA